MTTRQELISSLERLLRDLKIAKEKANKLARDKFVSEDERKRFSKDYTDDIAVYEKRIRRILEQYDDCPQRFHHHYERHAESFWNEVPGSEYSSSVFIMTKFTEPGDPNAAKLQGVIDCTMRAVRDRGYHPRIAQGPTFNDWLWANVEAHLLFCKQGIAILEDRYRPELNPNVALEWGWMLGMGRKVIYLREKSFSKERADWLGRISYEFDWDEPELGIKEAIEKDLPKRA